MYRDPQPPVACADCGAAIALGTGTAVDFGTGLSCAPCTERQRQLLARLAAGSEPSGSPILATLSVVLRALAFVATAWIITRYGIPFLTPLVVATALGLGAGIVANKRDGGGDVRAAIGIALNAFILLPALLLLVARVLLGVY